MEVSTDKNWDENVELKPLSICKEAFVSLIEEEKLLLTTKKFFDVGLNRSLIFYGLPGSGKTTAAYRLTENLGGRLLVVNGWSLSNRPVESILNVVNLVNPSVILFDDLDRIEDINSLLSDIEQLKKETIINSRLFIATVNNLSAIDPALRRPGRFDQAIKFDPPNLEDRYKILKVHAQQLNIEGKEKFYKDLAKATEGLTGAFLKELLLRYMILKDEKEILADINRMKEVSGLFDNCDCEDECNEISFSNILKPTVAPNVSRKRKK
jgi:SpoVK/Ycf46/Vps4 family AAA+-type ATPase